MKTLKGMIAGTALAALAGALNGCAPAVVASRPRPVIYSPAPAPVQAVAVPVAPVAPVPVAVVPVVPAWAPPYAYPTEVHYYYFPDYMVYYNVFTSHYCYYNGYSWLTVAVLPSLPLYYGFNPYNTYLVVLNRHTVDPWMHHNYYTQQYPSGYYQAAYAPRTRLSSDTRLRAYDENQSRPLFVDKRTNREVKVQYTETPRTSVSTNTGERRAESTDSRNNLQMNSRNSESVNKGGRTRVETPATDSRGNVRQDTRTNESAVTRDRVQQPVAAPSNKESLRTPVRTETTARPAVRQETTSERNVSGGRADVRTTNERKATETRKPVTAPRVEERKADRSVSRSEINTQSVRKQETVRSESSGRVNVSSARPVRQEKAAPSDSREGDTRKSR